MPNIKLVCGDCLELMREMPDKSVDLVLTDPPYGIKAHGGVGGYGVAKARKYAGSWDNEIPPKEMFDEMLRVAKDVIIFGGNYFAHILPPAQHWIVWDKKGDIKFKNPYSDCELIYTNISKKTVKKITFKQQGFITDSRDKRYHPTQKPTELLAQLLEGYSTPESVVLDPFMGSGSTGVACVNTGRDFIGFEIDRGYFDIAEKRIKLAQEEQMKIKPREREPNGTEIL